MPCEFFFLSYRIGQGQGEYNSLYNSSCSCKCFVLDLLLCYTSIENYPTMCENEKKNNASQLSLTFYY
jgi:hypothetical protein